MLKINVDYSFKENCIIGIDTFLLNKKKDWFNRDDVKRIIKGIDNTIAVKDEYLESPVFGGMSQERLSTGCKAVILMAVMDNINIYATRCGDNCVPYILEVAKTKDVEITLHHCMVFPREGWEALILDTGKIVHSRKEFVHEYYKVSSTFKYL